MKNLLILLFIPFVCLGQVKYILNDSILMQKLKFCYFGDTIIYNDLSDEFYQPLPKCSNGTYHTFIVHSNYLIVYPETIGYQGSGGGWVFLYKKENSEFKLIDEIWGDLDLEKTNFDSSVFYYLKNDKSTESYVTYEYEFVIDKKNDKFLIKNKTVREVWGNKP
jgi:hypothetical protein